MKTHTTTIKTPRNRNLELYFEPENDETEEQPPIQTPNPNLPQEPTLHHRKQEASKPLYLTRYE